MKILGTIRREFAVFLASILIGVIIAFIAELFGLLDISGTNRRGGQYSTFSEERLVAAILFPYALTLSCRLVLFIVAALKRSDE